MNSFTAAKQDKNVNKRIYQTCLKWSEARLQEKKNPKKKRQKRDQSITKRKWEGVCVRGKGVWVASRTNFNNMSLCSGPDHPTTTTECWWACRHDNGTASEPTRVLEEWGDVAGVCVRVCVFTVTQGKRRTHRGCNPGSVLKIWSRLVNIIPGVLHL